jgi:ribosomal protein S18 acetylase RimI-like enzyme
LKGSRKRSLDELLAEDVLRACEENYINYWRCVGASPNAEFSESGGITQCITGIRQDVFNVVLKCNLNPETIDDEIDRAIEDYRSRRIPLLWHPGLLSEPGDIGKRLEAKGFPHDYDLAAMAVDLESMDELRPPESVTVRIVNSMRDCEDWARCLARSWESPENTESWMLQNACFDLSIEREMGLSLPRRMYLGFLDGRAVGASILVWSDNIVGLEMVGTIHSARGKGVGSAIIRNALADARAMGFKFAVVLSTVEGLRLYEKNGFKEYGKLPEHTLDFGT